MIPWVVAAGALAVLVLGTAASRSRRVRRRELSSPGACRLTGLGNGAVLRRELGAALAEGRPCTVVAVRIERFEQMRHSLGRADADRLMLRVGQRLRSAARPTAVAPRRAPAEPAVLVADARPEVAEDVARRIR